MKKSESPNEARAREELLQFREKNISNIVRRSQEKGKDLSFECSTDSPDPRVNLSPLAGFLENNDHASLFDNEVPSINELQETVDELETSLLSIKLAESQAPPKKTKKVRTKKNYLDGTESADEIAKFNRQVIEQLKERAHRLQLPWNSGGNELGNAINMTLSKEATRKEHIKTHLSNTRQLSKKTLPSSLDVETMPKVESSPFRPVKKAISTKSKFTSKIEEYKQTLSSTVINEEPVVNLEASTSTSLNFLEIDKLHASVKEQDRSNCSPHVYHQLFPCSVDRFRCNINALVDDDWIENHRLPFREVIIKAKEVVGVKDLFTRESVFDPHELKKQLFQMTQGESRASESLSMGNLRRFLQYFSLQLVLVIYDVQFQVIGTFSVTDDNSFPGISFGPSYLLPDRGARARDGQLVNLLEIDFTVLPSNIFAIVPLLVDDSIATSKEDCQRSYFQDMDMRVQYFVRDQLDKEIIDPIMNSRNQNSRFHFHQYCHGEEKDYIEELHSKFDDSLDMDLLYHEVDQYNVHHEVFPPPSFIVACCDGIDDQWNEERNSQSQLQREMKSVSRGLRNQLRRKASKSDIASLFRSRRQGIMINNDSQARQKQVKVLAEEDDLAWMRDSWALEDYGVANDKSSPDRKKYHETLYSEHSQKSKRRCSSGIDPFRARMLQLTNMNGKQWYYLGHSKFSRGMEHFVSNSSSNQFASEMFFGKEAMALFAIFRASHASKGWHFKTFAQGRISHRSVDEIINKVTHLLMENRICPYSVIHIEHCINCHQHAKSTRHIPGSYEKHCESLLHQIRPRMLPFVLSKAEKKMRRPRIGAFEVTIRPFNETSSFCIFSKLRNKSFPNSLEILREASLQLLPESIESLSPNEVILEVILFDAYTKRPLNNANVLLFEVESAATCKKEIDIHSHDMDGMECQTDCPSFNSCHVDTSNSCEKGSLHIVGSSSDRLLDNEDEDTNENSPIHQDIQETAHQCDDSRTSSPPRINEKSTRIEEDMKPKTMGGLSTPLKPTQKIVDRTDSEYAISNSHRDLLESHSYESFKMRHSIGYRKLQLWNKKDVEEWFLKHNLSSEITNKAFLHGIVDGPSFLSKISLSLLKSWGVINRRQLFELEDSMKQIFTFDLPDRVKNLSVLQECHSLRSLQFSLRSEGIRATKDEDSLIPLNYCGMGITSPAGICRFKISKLGSYIVKVKHGLLNSTSMSPSAVQYAQEYCSHVVPIWSQQRMGLAISLPPILVRILVVIFLQDCGDLDLPNIQEESCLFSFVNLYNNVKHIGHATRSVVSYHPKRVPDPKKMENSPTIQAQTKKFGSRSGSIFGNTSVQSEKNNASHDHVKVKNRRHVHFFGGEIWLPVGKYYSEIDGSVVHVNYSSSRVDIRLNGKISTDMNKDESVPCEKIAMGTLYELQNIMRNSFSELPSARSPEDIQAPTSKTLEGYVLDLLKEKYLQSYLETEYFMSYGYPLAIKCHNRIIRKAKTIFQRLIRRYTIANLQFRMICFNVIRPRMLKYLALIREKIRIKKIVKIQSFFRLYLERKKYLHILYAVVILQSHQRGIARRRLFRQMKWARMVPYIQRRYHRYYLRLLENRKIELLRQRDEAARKIQVIWKVYQELCSPGSNSKVLSMRHNNILILRLKQFNDEKRNQRIQRLESGLMSSEDRWMKRFLLAEAMMLQRKKEKDAADIEYRLKRYQARQTYLEQIRIQHAVQIAKIIRGFLMKRRFRKMMKGFRTLQNIVRMRRHRRLVKQKPRKRKGPTFRFDRKYALANSVTLSSDEKLSSPQRLDTRSSMIWKSVFGTPESHNNSEISSPKSINTRSSFLKRFELAARNILNVSNDDLSDNHPKINLVEDICNGNSQDVANVPNNAILQEEENDEANSSLSAREYPQNENPEERDESQAINDSIVRDEDIKEKNHEKEMEDSTPLNSAVKSISTLLSALQDGMKRLSLIDFARMRSKKSDQESKENDNEDQFVSLKPNLTIITDDSGEENHRGNANGDGVGTLVEKLAKSASETVKSLTEKTVNATQDFVARQVEAKERYDRRENGVVDIRDALLSIRGKTMIYLPRIDRQWYICVFPKQSSLRKGEENDQTNESWRDEMLHQDNVSSSQLQGPLKVLIPDPFYYRNNNRNSSDFFLREKTQSVPIFPFSRESLQSLSFFTHLTDIIRYTEIEIVIFIESSSPVALQPSTSLEKRSNDMGIITVQTSTKKNIKRRFIPAFFGEIPIARGSLFGPCGGRLHMSLKCNTSDVLQLPLGRKLLEHGGLDLIITCFPVAIPSSRFLRTFRGFSRVSPCYPSHLVDCEYLEPQDVEWDSISGSAICGACYHDKILLSVRNRSNYTEIVEIDRQGKIAGKLNTLVTENFDTGNILVILAGHRHVVGCCSTGTLLVFQSLEYQDKKGSSSLFFGEEEKRWSDVNCVQVHPQKRSIFVGCILGHAGMDITFTVDRSNGIAISYFDHGHCLRYFYNESFLSNPITSIAVFGHQLYVGMNEGTIAVLNLYSILNESIEFSGELHRYVVRLESLFLNRCPISCLTILSANGFLGLKDEDELIREELARAKKFLSKFQDPVKYEVIEGHILLVGGGDLHPVVKLFHPHPTGMREVVTLEGHKKAITHIDCDAAGRFIMTASAAEKTIYIWDGLSFTCENRFEDVNIAHAFLGYNSLIITSFKPPFVRLWSSFDVSKPTKSKEVAPPHTPSRYLLSPLSSSKPKKDIFLKNRYAVSMNDSETEEDILESDIKMCRSAAWCYSMLKGGQYVPTKSIERMSYIHELSKSILQRWKFQYYRMDAREKISFKTNKTPRSLRSETPRARARRQFDDIQSNGDDFSFYYNKKKTLLGDLKGQQSIRGSNDFSLNGMMTIEEEDLINSDPHESDHIRKRLFFFNDDAHDEPDKNNKTNNPNNVRLDLNTKDVGLSQSDSPSLDLKSHPNMSQDPLLSFARGKIQFVEDEDEDKDEDNEEDEENSVLVMDDDDKVIDNYDMGSESKKRVEKRGQSKNRYVSSQSHSEKSVRIPQLNRHQLKKLREEEQAKRRVIEARQQKLRPRCTVHLNEVDSDSNSDDSDSMDVDTKKAAME